MIIRQWRLVAAGTLLVFVTGFMALFIIDFRYDVMASLMLKIGREMTAPPTATVERNEVMPVSKRAEDLMNEIEIMRSRHLLEAVVDYFGEDYFYAEPEAKTLFKEVKRFFSNQLKSLRAAVEEIMIHFGWRRHLNRTEKVVKALDAALIIEPVRKSDVIQLSLRMKDPVMGTQVMGKLIELYLEMRQGVYNTPGAEEFFDSEVSLIRSDLEKAESLRDQFKEKNQAWLADEQRMRLVLRRQENWDAIGKIRVDLSTLESETKLLADYLKNSPETLELSKVDQRNEVLDTLRKRLVDVQSEYKRRQTFYPDENPLVQESARQIELIEKNIADEERITTHSITTGINQQAAQMKSLLVTKQSELAGLKARLEGQQGLLGEVEKQLEKMDRASTIYERLEREVTRLRDNYLLQRKNQEIVKISTAMKRWNIANVSVLSPPTAGYLPSWPPIKMMLPGALVVGLFGSIGLLLVLEAIRPRLHTPASVKKVLESSVVAQIPEEKALPAPTATDLDSGPFSREMVRLASQLTEPQRPHGSLIMTGPSGKEGVTTLTIFLAAILAKKMGYRVLYAASSGLPNSLRASPIPTVPASGTGIGSVKDGGITYQKTAVSENLHALSLENERDMPSLFLREDHLRALAERLKQDFDLVLWDMPAVNSSYKTTALARLGDGLLLVIEADETRADRLASAAEQLEGLNANLLGVVMNRCGRFIPRSLA